MGSIHPRNKRLLGSRLARAARAAVYGDAKVAFTGPVLAGCAVAPGKLELTFDLAMLRGETINFKACGSCVHVYHVCMSGPRRAPPPRVAVVAALLTIRLFLEQAKGSTNNLTQNLEVKPSGEDWVALPISSVQGNVVSAVLAARVEKLTAVRYAFYDNPACPAAYDTFHLPGNKPYWCLDKSYDVTKPGSGLDPVNECALYTAPSDLPAVPFIYAIVDNKCVMAASDTTMLKLASPHAEHQVLKTSPADVAALVDATTAPTGRIEIAPGVHMPFVNDGVIIDTKKPNGTKEPEETTGLELFFSSGGRGADTAWSYFNQPAVGRALAESKAAPRAELFLTTKIECTGSAESAYAAIQRDLRLLGRDHPDEITYVDLVLIHAPYHGFGEPYSNCSKGPAGAAARRATWVGMERAVKDGLARAIGVSNFNVEYLNEIMQGAAIPPAVNQCAASPVQHIIYCLSALPLRLVSYVC
jgi:hypothetical protein